MTYDYAVTAARAVDGDTYYLTLDVGFRISTVIECRLIGWDCPEKRSSASHKITEWEAAEAISAQSLAQEWLASAIKSRCRVTTQPDPEKYGRWLGTVYRLPDFSDLGVALGQAELAVPYDGTSRTKRWWQVHPDPGATA